MSRNCNNPVRANVSRVAQSHGVGCTVADQSGSAPGARPSTYGPKFSRFHAVFLENLTKIVCWCPLLQGILDPPLVYKSTVYKHPLYLIMHLSCDSIMDFHDFSKGIRTLEKFCRKGIFCGKMADFFKTSIFRNPIVFRQQINIFSLGIFGKMAYFFKTSIHSNPIDFHNKIVRFLQQNGLSIF